MLRTSFTTLLVSSFAFLTLISCSDTVGDDYVVIQQLQESTDRLLEQTEDFEAIVEAYDSVIHALDNFMDKHKEGEWVFKAQADLEMWQARKTNYENEFSLLIEKREYEKIKQLQEYTDRLLEQTKDIDAIAEGCDSIINTLGDFIDKHKEGEWVSKAQADLKIWQMKKTNYKNEFALLIEKQEYEKIQQLQESTNLLLKNTYDFDIILESCTKVIDALSKYISDYKNGRWANVSSTELKSWKSRKSAYESNFDSLYNRLDQQLESKATDVAKDHHRMSKIEELKLNAKNEEKDGDNITIHSSYDVRMRGTLIGNHVFKFQVSVIGFIDMANKQTVVSDSVVVVE